MRIRLTFPGRISPGLIEASTTGTAIWAPLHRDFPGESARASLKHDVGGTRRSLRPVFPGRISPGLIEAATAPTCPGSSAPISGRISPGLIEAGAARSSIGGGSSNVFPGRISPGPH